MTDNLLNNWSTDDFNSLEKSVLLGHHKLVETGLFSDESLARIIDNHPDKYLSINIMGSDTNEFEWREGDRNGVAGETLLDLVLQGRFWLNLRRVHDHQPELSKIINQLYDELEANSPGFIAQNRSSNLLISSPDALVHYHLDTPVNMLWHLRGRKRVYVYPPFDQRFAANKYIENCCSGEFTDEIPYDPEFDKYALKFDVEPGQILTWPQMTPHRVDNLEGLNVSLSTEHSNPRANRRYNIHLANQMLRNSIGHFCTSTSPDDFAGQLKNFGYRVTRKVSHLLGLNGEQECYTYPKSFIVDSSSPTGYKLLNLSEEELVAPHMKERVTT
jgi:Cupin-like domain